MGMIFGHAWKNVRLQSERPVTLGVKAAENIPKFPTFPLAGGRMPSNSKVVAVAGADLFPETKKRGLSESGVSALTWPYRHPAIGTLLRTRPVDRCGDAKQAIKVVAMIRTKLLFYRIVEVLDLLPLPQCVSKVPKRLQAVAGIDDEAGNNV